MATLHLVPHTHWDREWYQPFQVFRMRLVHLVDLLLDILAAEPGFRHFMLDGQTIVLEDYLAIRPQREAELAAHIRTGRILIGPWYLLPDEFLISPEALVRNLLRGASLSARFEARMDVGYLPDPFGHIGQMPQILQGFGIQTAAFRRGLADEPCELWWEAPDGSRLFVSYLRDGYDNAARLPTNPVAFRAFIAERRDSLSPHCAVSHMLLLNGTDHHEPQPEAPSLVASWDEAGGRLIISTLPAYFSAVQAEVNERDLRLPTVQGELRNPKRHHLLAGVLSSRVWIKQRNHACETLLERWAEPFSAWADLAAGDLPDRSVWTGLLALPRLRQPHALLGEAWRLLLQCQPHDSICGCSTDQVHDEMRSRFDQCEQIGEEITRQSLSALADVINTNAIAPASARAALVAFNPSSQKRTGLAAAHLQLPAGLDPFAIVDEAGAPIPYHILRSKSRQLTDVTLDRQGLQGMLGMVRGGKVMGLSIQAVAVVRHGEQALVDVVLAEEAEPDERAVGEGMAEVNRLLEDETLQTIRLVARFATEVWCEFAPPAVPGHGYRAFALQPAQHGPQGERLAAGRSIANDFLALQAEKDGTLTLTDLRSGETFPGLLRFSDQAERGDSYTFCPLEGDTPIQQPAQAPEVQILETPCWKALQINLVYAIPARLEDDRGARGTEFVDLPLHVQARLIPGVPRVDLTVQVRNRADDHRLQVHFPLPFALQTALYDGHYEIVERPTMLEAGAPEWAEQPAPEKPMRHFVAAGDGKRGLMISTRGLREASASAEGTLAVTLLRCFGWLSRNDLATRKGGAGPELPTPGGQMHGEHTFHLSLIPFADDINPALAEAEAFQCGMRAVDARLQDGLLPAAASLLEIESPSFALTTVKQAEDGEGLIVRGVNLSSQTQQIRLRTLLPLQAATVVRLDEQNRRSVPIEDAGVEVQAGPWQIVSLRLHLEKPTRPSA